MKSTRSFNLLVLIISVYGNFAHPSSTTVGSLSNQKTDLAPAEKTTSNSSKNIEVNYIPPRSIDDSYSMESLEDDFNDPSFYKGKMKKVKSCPLFDELKAKYSSDTHSFRILGVGEIKDHIFHLCGRTEAVKVFEDKGRTKLAFSLPLCLQARTIPDPSDEFSTVSNQRLFKIVETNETLVQLLDCEGKLYWMERNKVATPLSLRLDGKIHPLEFQIFFGKFNEEGVYKIGIDWCGEARSKIIIPKELQEGKFERIYIEGTQGGGTLENSECRRGGC